LAAFVNPPFIAVGPKDPWTHGSSFPVDQTFSNTADVGGPERKGAVRAGMHDSGRERVQAHQSSVELEHECLIVRASRTEHRVHILKYHGILNTVERIWAVRDTTA